MRKVYHGTRNHQWTQQMNCHVKYGSHHNEAWDSQANIQWTDDLEQSFHSFLHPMD